MKWHKKYTTPPGLNLEKTEWPHLCEIYIVLANIEVTLKELS